jgi:hypothetical protein
LPLFWFSTASRDVLLCIGIHGQLVYIDRATGMVGVKLSSGGLLPSMTGAPK